MKIAYDSWFHLITKSQKGIMSKCDSCRKAPEKTDHHFLATELSPWPSHFIQFFGAVCESLNYNRLS